MDRTYRGNMRHILAGYVVPVGLLLYLAAHFLVWPRLLRWLEKVDPEVAGHFPPPWVIFGIVFLIILAVLRWHIFRRYILLREESLLYEDDERSVEIPYESIEHVQCSEVSVKGALQPVRIYRVKSGMAEIAFGALRVFALRDHFTEDSDRDALYLREGAEGDRCEAPWRNYQGYRRYAVICGEGRGITVLGSIQDFDRLAAEVVRRADLSPSPRDG